VGRASTCSFWRQPRIVAGWQEALEDAYNEGILDRKLCLKLACRSRRDREDYYSDEMDCGRLQQPKS
jgi:hypothetical protein